MKKLKILSISLIAFTLFSCGDKEEPINKFEAILGSWISTGYSGSFMGELFTIDSVDWNVNIEFESDSVCYYNEGNWSIDTVANYDTGSFYIANDTLYILDISPILIDFNKPIRGRIDFKNNEFIFKYKLVNAETGAVAEIERYFEKQ